MPIEFRLLGPLEVVEHERPLPLGGGKQRSFLALLLLNANEVVSTERLIDELWGESPPATVAKSVHVYVSRLRKHLGDGRLVTRAPGYLLRVDPSELDLTAFQRLVAEAENADPATAALKLRQALALWRGPPLADLAYEPFAQAEIGRLEELRLAALERRIDAELASGRHAELVGDLEALATEHPLRERLRGQLMLCLYRSGRQAEALDSYQEARRVLVEELGIEPGRELRELHQAILVQDPGIDAPAAAGAPSGAFVGRERELAELVAGLDDAFAGRGRVFLLGGEPGIGKSRLAEELIAHARTRGARVLVGRCWEAGGAPAYWPWVQSLRAYVRDSDTAALRSQIGAGAAELAQIVPELRRHFPDLREPPSVESEGARFRLFDATADFLRNASQRRPIVLVLDDLHAADTPSLLLLQFLARNLGSSRMLVLGAYRDTDPVPGQPLAEVLAEIAREPVARRLRLGGLSECEVAQYVESTASDIASPQVVAAVHEEAEGNPLFVSEIVRLLTAEGVSDSPAGLRLAIPEGVRDVISRRLTHLSQEANRLLLFASVLGREFAIDVLARLAAVSEDELLDKLDEAMAARVVSDLPGGPGRVRFAHVLIRDTLYEGLSSARRIRLHRLVLAALEGLYGDEPGPHLAEFTHHAIAGRAFDTGLHYARRAGDRALALLAYEEAARLYQTALEALELAGVMDESARCELLLSLGEAQARAGNTPAAKTAFLDAAALARRLALPRHLARAVLGYGGRIVFARAGDDDRLVPLLEEALSALADDDVELRARLLARLAGALRDQHSRDRRNKLSREAVELARRTGNPAALAYALDGRAVAIVAPDTVSEVLSLGSELRDVAAASGNPELLASAHSHRLIAQLVAGDVRGAHVDLAASTRIAHELRQPAHLWRVSGERAMLALATGSLGEADRLVADALALGERAQRSEAIPVHRLQRYALCDFRERLAEAEPGIRELVIEYPARPVFRCTLAHVHARLGRLPEAQQALDDLAKDNVSALPFDQEWLYGMSLLAETCALLCDADAAAVLFALLLPYAGFNAVDVAEGFRGSVSRYLGLLASTMSHWDEAGRHFEEAVAMNARMGAYPWLAHAQRDYASVLLRRARGRDEEQARHLLRQALATYRQLGMETYARACRTVLTGARA